MTASTILGCYGYNGIDSSFINYYHLELHEMYEANLYIIKMSIKIQSLTF